MKILKYDVDDKKTTENDAGKGDRKLENVLLEDDSKVELWESVVHL